MRGVFNKYLPYVLWIFLSFSFMHCGSSGGSSDSSDSDDELLTTLPASLRLAIFQALAEEMETLDGGWILNRSLRSKSWDTVISELEDQLHSATTGSAIPLAFWRLDQAYPNQHSFIKMGDDLGEALPDAQYPLVEFGVEWSSLEDIRFKISSISSNFSNSADIEVGDELTHINGTSLSDWLTTYYNYCKKPTKGHCAFDFYEDFLSGLLSEYFAGDNLTYTVTHNGSSVTFDVDLEGGPPSSSDDTEACGDETNRYSGWTLAYEGNRACIYTNSSHSGVALLRIPSFGYDGSSSSSITNVDEEVQVLFDNWWQANSATVTHLIVDLTDNGGGDPSSSYFKLFVTEDFQSPWAALKKAEIYSDSSVQEELLLDRGQIDALIESGEWDLIAAGDFLDSLPMFCVSDDDCANSYEEPLAHSFTGNITALINPSCISSCDDFVNLLDDLLGTRARFVGLPNGADSALMRFQLVIYLDDNEEDGFRLTREVDTSVEAPSGALLAQIIAVTRPTLYQSNTARTAEAVTLNQFVAFEVGDDDTYYLKALEAALDL